MYLALSLSLIEDIGVFCLIVIMLEFCTESIVFIFKLL